MTTTPAGLPSAVSIQAGPSTAPTRVPREFARIRDLAENMWWVWDREAYDLWGRIDPQVWARNKNPLTLLSFVDSQTWEVLSDSASFNELYQTVVSRFDAYIRGQGTWFARHFGDRFGGSVAYLCAEFGLHQTLPFYSGGLGILAGDHLKAASDLGVPLVAVGLFYRRGYFQQRVDPDGYQQAEYRDLETARRGIRPIMDRSGHPLRVEVELPGRTVHIGAWMIQVGRIPLVLLDTDLKENDPADRPITHMLYVRGREMRLCQELVLGIGGVRVLDALGIDPVAWHINEGHSAFSVLERLAKRIDSVDFEKAREEIRDNTLFTLHTPVPAGNEVFEATMVERYLAAAVPEVPQEHLRELGVGPSGDPHRFDMGALAIRFASKVNGVSQRHGQVVTHDWGGVIGGKSGAITNGIHTPTWIGRAMSRLYERNIGPDWAELLTEPETWQAIHDVPDAEVWEAHQQQKEVMLRNLRNRLVTQAARHGADPDRLRWFYDQLPSDRLTITFARRFATYKRAGLLFSDPGRIRWLLTNPERPMQIVFAGKAHPADREGQGLIKWVVDIAKTHDLEGHLFFIENYDMALAQYLVSGTDVWLNTPRPPMEASGTSGMKAAANGGLNLSVLDGWWVEGCTANTGWGFSENTASDAEDAAVLYHLLESAVLPAYYDRNEAGIPVSWVRMMKAAMAELTPAFSAHRMVTEYTEAYAPLAGVEVAAT